MAREQWAARPYGGRIVTRISDLRRALTTALRPFPDFRAGDPADGRSAATSSTEAISLDDRRRHRRGLYGRLAAVLIAGSGTLGLVTLPLPAPGSNAAATAAVSASAIILGIAVWFAPWAKWPQWVNLCIVPPVFALIALSNAFGGADMHTYSVFFVVTFVWIGITQPPRTSVVMAPVAAAAYILPLLFMSGSFWTGISSTAVTIPSCVLVGEGIAWCVGRLDQIEMAWQLERDRADHLRELDEMKDAFLSAVSHELRTPITICRGHLEVLEDGAGEQEIKAVKETLVDELALMGRLVDDLATLARIDDPALIKLETLPADEFLHTMAPKAETILRDRLRVEPGVPGAEFRADPQRLTQALLNLAQNAAQHAAGNGPVHLRVRPEPSRWCLEVTDEGGGVPPGEEELIFEMFMTGSSGTGGTGLGLAIVRGIARAHGGEAGVANRPGHGATFWIRIPR
jgi:signal transduction histidine kinase